MCPECAAAQGNTHGPEVRPEQDTLALSSAAVQQAAVVLPVPNLAEQPEPPQVPHLGSQQMVCEPSGIELGGQPLNGMALKLRNAPVYMQLSFDRVGSSEYSVSITRMSSPDSALARVGVELTSITEATVVSAEVPGILVVAVFETLCARPSL